MLRKITTAALSGIEAGIINVEIDVQPGLPYVHVVGLADATIKEARERVRGAIVNSGYEYPKQRVTISLSPAGLPKEGSHFDLPIAVGLLGTYFKGMVTDGTGFIGELSLDGTVKGVKGALPLTMQMRKEGVRRLVVPADNAAEISLLDDVDIYPVGTLQECVDFLNGKKKISVYKRKENTQKTQESIPDFADVKGNEYVKRALVIAAAGNHGILMTGRPGCGKTMMARRLPYIMPEMNYNEMLEVARIYSVAGMADDEVVLSGRRPFRAPHHTITRTALAGGGVIPHPGEISLAHNGVLFLDELGEFSSGVLDMLRQPMEEGIIRINRAKMTVDLPCRMMLVAASNPCKCGYLGDEEHMCTCTPRQLESYYSRFSGPLMDRIDMHITVNPVSEEVFRSTETGLTTAEMKDMVKSAVEVQRMRYGENRTVFNSRLQETELKEFCRVDREGEALLQTAFVKYGMSMRAYSKVLRVSRTIADLEGTEQIRCVHIAEALSYRALEGVGSK